MVHRAIGTNDPERSRQLGALEDLGELWKTIMELIDQVVQLARPKRLLYLAIDGVCPQAKQMSSR